MAVASREVRGVTGTTTTILEHSRRLAALGWEVDVFGEKLDRSRIAAAGAVPRRLLGLPWGSYVKRRLFAWRFGRVLGRESYDLVWGHGDTLFQDVLSLHNCVHAAHEAARGAPLPAASGVGRLHRLILEGGGFRLLVANSALMRDDVARRFGVPAERIVVIHPGHDPVRFRAEDRARLGAAARRELGLGADAVVAGLITSGDFAKRGVSIFLEALGRLPGHLKPRVAGLVVGHDKGLAEYRRQAAAAGVRVEFREPTRTVERAFHALDIYVHPALYEEFGQSLQEAMACGLPVLTHARVGAAELLPAPARAHLTDGSAAGLSAGIARLAEDPGLRWRLGDADRRAAEGNTWDANFSATLELHERVLGEKEAAAGTGRKM